MIKINDDYYIKSDEHNFILYETREVTDEAKKNYGNGVDVVLGYFGTLEHALQYLLKHNARKIIMSKNYNLKQALDDIKRYNDELIKAIRG